MPLRVNAKRKRRVCSGRGSGRRDLPTSRYAERGRRYRTAVIEYGKRMRYNGNIRKDGLTGMKFAGKEKTEKGNAVTRASVSTRYGEIEFDLLRGGVRRLNLRVRRDGSVAVNAPASMPFREIENFLLRRAGWVSRHVDEALKRLAPSFSEEGYAPLFGERVPVVVKDGAVARAVFSEGKIAVTSPDCDKEAADRAVSRLLVRTAREELPTIFRRAEESLGGRFGAPVRVEVRLMRSRWGSCDRKNRVIRLSAMLVAAPAECVRYVCMHELAHLEEGGHDRDFYALLKEICPRHAELRRRLNEETERLFQKI